MLAIILDPDSKVFIYEQIYHYIKEEIKNGTIAPHSKLPSTRLLANNLGISRNTVDLAYSQLLSEGYIESRPKSGYYVCHLSEPLVHYIKSEQPELFQEETINPYQYDFSPFTNDINNFPFHTWRKLAKEAMSEHNNHLFLLGNSAGDMDLRMAISDYLRSFRSVNCNPEQIIIGAGADYLIQLLCQILKVNNISTIAMENPTYMRAYNIFKGFSYKVLPIQLDKYGISIEELDKSYANVAYVTPSHQYPLGIVMPITRRLELLNWANQGARYIIEDDHDSEFRYKGKPIPSLQGIDTKEKVIYLGTFSRALTKALRIGYMVLPKDLYHIYKTNFNYYSSTVSRVDQHILTGFIKGGYFERHLNKMRKLYKSKQERLLKTLKIFGDKVEVYGEHAGLHLVVRFLLDITEDELIAIASKHSIKLYPLSKHYIVLGSYSSLEYKRDKVLTEKEVPLSFLFGFANLSEEELERGILTLYEALKKRI